MILSTHAIVGGAVASLFPSHPVLVAIAGFASHFVIDAIPHWDYPLQAISTKRGADNRCQLIIDRHLLFDATLISLDTCAGLAMAAWLFATPATIGAIVLGAIAGMAPDPLRFAQKLYPREPLNSLQRFHRWVHAKQRLTWPDWRQLAGAFRGDGIGNCDRAQVTAGADVRPGLAEGAVAERVVKIFARVMLNSQ